MHASTIAGWPFPQIAGFEIVRRIGGGGASTVCEALSAKGRVALKIVDLRGDSARARFSREVWIGSMFDHPSVIAPLEARAAERIGWIAMPLLEGCTLEQAQADTRFTFEERAVVIDRIGRALAHVHERGVLHCDVKPSNVFLTADGGVKILDFGAAMFAHEGQTPRKTFYGTHRYVAPERIRGQPIDGRSDVFSLGVLAFEVLTGRPPWEAPNAATLLYAMCSKPPMSFRRAALASPLPIPRAAIGDLRQIIETALAGDPKKRFGSMSAFVAAWSSSVLCTQCKSACG